MLYNPIFFNICVSLYFLSFSIFAFSLIKKNDGIFIYFKQWFLVASLSGFLFLIIRYQESGHVPLVTLFEITFFYAWMIGILFLIFVKKDIMRFIHSIILLIIFSLLLWDLFIDRNIYPLNPMLDSYWLVIHVPTAMVSYSAFALSFAFSLYYVIAEKMKWPLGSIVSLNSGLIFWGSILLAVCIVTGSVWAKSAWGTYWSWDPKETWALITLIIYTLNIAARKIFKLDPKWQAYISIVGFITMLFTFFGISLFFNSTHAYA